MQHVEGAVPASTAALAAGRRFPLLRLRPRGASQPGYLPYLLLAPSVIALGVALGYPLVNLVLISFQHFRARELILGLPPQWIGFDNYGYIVGRPDFWAVLSRTLAFAGVNVVVTIVVGMALAVLLSLLGTRMRIALSLSMVLAWVIPTVTATQVWMWLFDRDFGVVNWVLNILRPGQFVQHSWTSDPLSLLGVATVVVVWGALPFVSLTLYAGLTQVPEELYEAARVDGAGGFAMFRQVTLPLIMPIVMLLVVLSSIWDFRVFTQIFVLQKTGGISEDTNLIGIWAYNQSFGGTPNYGRGAATSFIGVLILLLITAVLIRRMVRQGEDL